MRIDILTLFPDMFKGVLDASILGRAVRNGLIEIHTHDIRDWADNKHRKADDEPFGGGAGLVMMIQPLFDCLSEVTGEDKGAKRILLTPRGKPLTTERARSFSKEERLILVCGHYEGVDERIMELIDEEISIGDYVLTGGELPAMVLIDSVARFIPGVLGCDSSTEEESFADGLLEYPQYTRPADFRGRTVPEVLLSGHAANIRIWRHEMARIKTKENRPDLFALLPPEPEKKRKNSRKKQD